LHSQVSDGHRSIPRGPLHEHLNEGSLQQHEHPTSLDPPHNSRSHTKLQPNMSNFFDDVIGTPRKRSKTPARSSLATPSPLRREQSADLFHSALAVPTQATFASKREARGRSSVAGVPTSVDIKPYPDEVGRSELSPAEIPLPPELPPAQEGDQVKEEVRTQDEPVKDGPFKYAPSQDPVEVPAPTQDKSMLESERDISTTLDVVPPIPVIHSQPAILIGISGCTSSGKTMLSHLLSWVLPTATPRFVLHQDDFFIPKHFLIPSKDGELDADCRDAINFGALIRVLEYVKGEGKMPPGFHTDRDGTYERDHASTLVSEELLNDSREFLSKSSHFENGQPVCIVEGFLLYHEPRIRELLDVKLFLRTTKEMARARRFEKPDYAGEQAKEEFWKTNAYFDRAVWPNYVEEHSVLFHGSDVEGAPRRKLCKQLGIQMQPRLEMSIEEVLRWATSSIAEQPKTMFIEASRDLDPEEVLGDRFEVCDCGSGWVGKIRRLLYDIV